jgi:1,4-alpha-glucan branching enzyme
MVADLNRLYRDKAALHEGDCTGEGFAWAVVDDKDQSVFAWTRSSADGQKILMISNMTPVRRDDYSAPVGADGFWREIFNSDAKVYDGGGEGNLGGRTASGGRLSLTLPPLSTLYFEFAPND